MDSQKFKEPEYFIAEEKSHHLKFDDLFRLSLRVFRARPTRTILTILGVSIGIGTVLFLVSLGFGLQYILIGNLAATEDSLVSLETYYPTETDLSISYADIDNIVSLPESEEISPQAEFFGEAEYSDLSGFLIVKVIKPNYFRLSGTKTDIGSIFTENENSLVISNTALKLLNLKENESSLGKHILVKLFYPTEGNEMKTVAIPSALKIKGIVVDEFAPPFVFIPSDLIPEKPPFFQRVFVKAKDINSVESLRDRLIEKGFLVSARIDLVNQAKKIMSIITIILGIFGVTALVISAIGMFNTMIIGFLERIFEIGIMKSIGATSRDIRNLFLMESVIMGLLGGIGGILVGVGAGEILNLGINFLASRLGGRPISLFIYPMNFILFILIISALVGLGAGFWPARRAAKLSAKQAFLQK